MAVTRQVWLFRRVCWVGGWGQFPSEKSTGERVTIIGMFKSVRSWVKGEPGR